MTRLILAIAAALILVWCYGAIHAVPTNEKKDTSKREDKSKCFCNGLSLPNERQCPLMSDL